MGDKFAIVIAVQTYQDLRIPPVEYAEADAKEFCRALKLHDFLDSNIGLLLSSSATKATIESKLKRVLSNLTREDQFVLFFAGHGFAENDHNFITCSDTQSGDLAATSISLQKLFETIRKSECQRVILFLDSCHSGLPIEEHMRGILSSMSEDELCQFFKDSEYYVAFASCKSDQYSYSNPSISHGIWSYHVIQALTGNAESALDKGDLLTGNSLQSYLSVEVPRMLRESRTGMISQTPCIFGNLTKDFIIADLKPILEAAKARARPQMTQLRQVSFIGEESGRVKSLSGFKRFYRVPTEVNKNTEDFVASIAAEETAQETNNLFQVIKTELGYKRKDMKTDIQKGSSSIICKDFDVVISICLNPNDPSKYLMRTEVYNFHNPEIVMAPTFNSAFEDTFDSLLFEFDRTIAVKRLIDRIEAANDEAIEVTYPPDCTFCEISIEGSKAQIKVDESGITIRTAKKSKPSILAEHFFNIQRLLVSKHSIKELPFTPKSLIQ